MNFTKSDLKTGMRVTTKHGETYLVLKQFSHTYNNDSDILVGYCGHSWEGLKNYNEDLTSRGDSSQNIVKVEVPNHCYSVLDQKYDSETAYKTLWNKNEIREVTLQEIEDQLGYKFKIVG